MFYGTVALSVQIRCPLLIASSIAWPLTLLGAEVTIHILVKIGMVSTTCMFLFLPFFWLYCMTMRQDQGLCTPRCKRALVRVTLPCDLGNRELLAFKLVLMKMCHQLEGIFHPLIIYMDHHNLHIRFRWALFFIQFFIHTLFSKGFELRTEMQTSCP